MDCRGSERNSLVQDVNITGDITTVMEIHQGTGGEMDGVGGVRKQQGELCPIMSC